MSDFGAELRRLRQEASLKQSELARLLGLARSTVANVEAGRERPSARLWESIATMRPDWVSLLAASYELARISIHRRTVHGELPPVEARGVADELAPLGGPFVLEQLTLTYMFQYSRAPSEIIEFRRVRSKQNGIDSYGLKLAQNNSGDFEVEEEALWGGHLEDCSYARGKGQTSYVRRFRFDKELRRGQVHEFATRCWVERDPTPSASVEFSLTIPAERVGIHLNFNGPERPRIYQPFGPLTDSILNPEHVGLDNPRVLPDTGHASEYFDSPAIGHPYGIAWEW